MNGPAVVDEPAESTTWSELFARRIGDDPAVVIDGGTWTSRQLARRGAGAADWLDAIGAVPGRPVAALLSSTAEAFSLVIGSIGSGRVLAPLGARLTAAEIAACLEPLAPSVVIAEPSAESTARAAAEPLALPVAVVPAFGESDRPLDLSPRPDDWAVMLHTSGTTGRPKPVPFRQDRLAARVRCNAALLGLGPGSLYVSTSPFHHIAGIGMLLVAMGSGATLCPLARFTADTWAEVIAMGTTHANVVPTVIEQLLADDRLERGALRCLQYGAAPIAPATARRLLDALPGVSVVQLYGQTEGSPITILSAEDHRRAADGAEHLLASVGSAVPGVEVVIHQPDGDGIGEIWARGAHLMRPGDDGWLRTGDLGRLDGDGFLYLTGRKGDMIIRGGENVYPEEVEQVLRGHPAVGDVAVVGLADQRLGQQVAAFVVAADPGHPPVPEELRAHTRAVLAGFKVPERWELVDELPRNAAGKLLRRVLVTGTEDRA